MIVKNNLFILVAAAAIIATAGLILNDYYSFFPLRQDTVSVASSEEKVNTGGNVISESAEEQIKPKTCAQVNKTDAPILEAYVVSQCPFGLQMQRVLSNIYESSPNLFDRIKVRYIGTMSSGKLYSMHGAKEAQENIRQICIREEQNNKYWDYISCHIKNGDVNGCLTSVGINQSQINSCMQDSTRGLAYAKEDVDLTAKYKIEGSPTLVINGQVVSEFDFGRRAPDTVKNILCCGYGNQPGGCSETLTNQEPATGFSETYLKGASKQAPKTGHEH